jgi:phosphoribosylformylglycinamidine synthase I
LFPFYFRKGFEMRFGVIVFPGTWSDQDCYHVLDKVLQQKVEYVWHKSTDLSGFDCVILPGGFSYGDYLRPGAIARFSPVMTSVKEFAAAGKLVMGICNGFQILCESGLLPGALMRNNHLQYRCQWTNLRTENAALPFTAKAAQGQVLRIPISHYEGSYYADEATLRELEAGGRVAFRYCTPSGEITPEANPNGALNNIAGIVNRAGNVLGMMPHPERACEDVVGGTDGSLIFQSIIDEVTTRAMGCVKQA